MFRDFESLQVTLLSAKNQDRSQIYLQDREYSVHRLEGATFITRTYSLMSAPDRPGDLEFERQLDSKLGSAEKAYLEETTLFGYQMTVRVNRL